MNAIKTAPVASKSVVMEYDFNLRKLVPVAPEIPEEIENREKFNAELEQKRIAKIAAEKAAQSTEKKDKTIKFLQHEVSKGDLKVKVRYSFYDDGSVCISAKECGRQLEKIFASSRNESHENSRVRIYSESPYFADAKKMADKMAII